ncbi:uncharacterized protein LOC105699918 isoform X2 [Orussus abietinus]|uniref:uncharacterized protein LOC105699918 isoform X2 n=1 Tax=Orussus abietinus TaxID=222816 RepID=UPI000626038A|nr:uncharacterized protein LOC105699918 isoform X2 [Orussus abietinus]
MMKYIVLISMLFVLGESQRPFYAGIGRYPGVHPRFTTTTASPINDLSRNRFNEIDTDKRNPELQPTYQVPSEVEKSKTNSRFDNGDNLDRRYFLYRPRGTPIYY